MNDASLSTTMKAGPAYLVKYRSLHRADGGYWTTDGNAPTYASWKAKEWVNTRTVGALVDRGLAALPDGQTLNGTRGAQTVFITKRGSDHA